jgi:hypothetical protein
MREAAGATEEIKDKCESRPGALGVLHHRPLADKAFIYAPAGSEIANELAEHTECESNGDFS